MSPESRVPSPPFQSIEARPQTLAQRANNRHSAPPKLRSTPAVMSLALGADFEGLDAFLIGRRTCSLAPRRGASRRALFRRLPTTLIDQLAASVSRRCPRTEGTPVRAPFASHGKACPAPYRSGTSGRVPFYPWSTPIIELLQRGNGDHSKVTLRQPTPPRFDENWNRRCLVQLARV